MNGVDKVSPETRNRVLKACKKLDYFPNPAARALSTKKSRTIAAIIPTIEHSVFAKFIAGIEQTLAERDYSLVLAVSNGDEDEEFRAARKLLGMGAEAFILSGAAHNKAMVEMLERRQVPHVFTSIWNPDCKSPTIGYDNFNLAANAVSFLAAKGHRNLAVIHGPLAESDRTVARREGAASVQTEPLVTEFHETSLSVEGGKSVIREILTRHSGVTAVLCFSDVLALGAYFGLSEAGLRIPDDMSVMGFDNLDWAKDAMPPLTTIDLPAAGMGREVASQLVDHLESDAALVPKLLPSRIIERESVRQLGGDCEQEAGG
ncbi:HTH-type transcriptional repressor CytR [Defluviimonas aquaemixtae]|uniref:HTH-type transcriptional repressor CytR n=2 Tax=Albidovulum aquaemixtae TaxID=1542388 RepID=A0A2R8B6W6_9RHOB|nr:HTH-type transcriptional repressor CytR [Defluviimonas aquaemixtae]